MCAWRCSSSEGNRPEARAGSRVHLSPGGARAKEVQCVSLEWDPSRGSRFCDDLGSARTFNGQSSSLSPGVAERMSDNGRRNAGSRVHWNPRGARAKEVQCVSMERDPSRGSRLRDDLGSARTSIDQSSSLSPSDAERASRALQQKSGDSSSTALESSRRARDE